MGMFVYSSEGSQRQLVPRHAVNSCKYEKPSYITCRLSLVYFPLRFIMSCHIYTPLLDFFIYKPEAHTRHVILLSSLSRLKTEAAALMDRPLYTVIHQNGDSVIDRNKQRGG